MHESIRVKFVTASLENHEIARCCSITPPAVWSTNEPMSVTTKSRSKIPKVALSCSPKIIELVRTIDQLELCRRRASQPRNTRRYDNGFDPKSEWHVLVVDRAGYSILRFHTAQRSGLFGALSCSANSVNQAIQTTVVVVVVTTTVTR
ncbi:hypothetical protein MPTK1_1g12560 [Marchantia polymorpha subsp. ruderalis]|uniref:Uncharacterized protein n=2 Tax=Marchantia polymorpha TaxID=3197 RepID=A0AAF6APE8_MARPO|nr:hypothetical protein MARPO_0019s0026 [Marchantia polymorpha]BBM98318.1 hypothetical protein Mp_1g12560 [Marchantia polymorpha subsp. ruderalis]|eukprot:PTQ44585.1 hypothetical protein MARPO_0019s0026 [Marchantia polymorpha]